MLGAIIGDIVGSRFEFNPTNDYNFEFFSKECSFTDDTICTVAVADTILEGRDYDFGKKIHEWCRKYPNPMGGYGGSFRRWVMSNDPQPYGSFGNGAAMRVSPVVFRWLNAGSGQMAKKAAECTHNHPEGIKSAQTTALAIFHGVELSNSGERINAESIRKWILNPCAKFSHYNIDLRKEDVENKFDETCQGTVPVALWIIGQSESFEDAIRKAVSLGADADTLGAIVGGIAEAIWGVPTEMAMKAMKYLPNEMQHVVVMFYAKCYFGKYNPLAGYGDEGAARDMLIEDALNELGEKFKQFAAMMHWKLGLGNFNKVLTNESPIPSKENIATADTWQIKPMPDTDVTTLPTSILVEGDDFAILQKGHIPDAMEDHWFMYCDDEYIRYYRSWTGICAFEAHYFHASNSSQVYIDQVTINPQGLMEFGVNGDIPALALFRYLLIAEVGGNAEGAWQAYINEWLLNYQKYSDKHEPERREIPDPNSDEFRKAFGSAEDNDIEVPIVNSAKTEKKEEEKVFHPYEGIEGKICEGCIYSGGIRPFNDSDANKLESMMGCGRLGIASFSQRYLSGKCEFRKTDLFIPSEFEQERINAAKEKVLHRNDPDFAKKLLKKFIEEKLNGNIDNLADFDFRTLDDGVFGHCQGPISVENSDIVEAIMCIAFADVWPDLNIKSLDHYTYKCSCINLTQYMFGANILDQFFKGMATFNPTEQQFQRALNVDHMTHRLGNMWILPNKLGDDKETLSSIKDTYKFHGYADRLLMAMYAAMTGNKYKPDLRGLLYKNRKLMTEYQGEEGLVKFIHNQLLFDYVDDQGLPVEVMPYVWTMQKGLTSEQYFDAVDKYCTFLESFIPKRGKMIVEKLKNRL
jgi:ADP-ribosylglycohydrolase